MKLIIQNCHNQNLTFQIPYTGEEEFEFPFVAALGLVDFEYLIPLESPGEVEGAIDCWTVYAEDEELETLGTIIGEVDGLLEEFESCEECLPIYITLTSCVDARVKYYTADLDLIPNYEIGGVYAITIDEEVGCYTLATQATFGILPLLPEDAEIGDMHETCAICAFEILPDYLIYTDCETDEIEFFQAEFLEEDVDKVFRLEGEGIVRCYHTSISKETGEAIELPEEIEFSGTFNTCNGCLPTHIECESKSLYTLIPCQGTGNVLVDDDSLEDLVGEYIRIPFLNNRCFRVTGPTAIENPDYYSPLPYEGPFADCFDCHPKMEVEPTLPERCCSGEKVEKAFCSFVDIMYRKMISERYGVKGIQKEDKFDMTLAKYKAVSNQLLCSDIPPLRIPKPTLCCIELEKVCVVPQSNCFSCEEKTTEKVKPAEDCLCEIADQEYECHEYSIRVTELRLSMATGNDDTNLNGRVFFSYYPCGSLKAKTKTYKRSGEDTFCVIGQPLFGYFRDNEFVEINTTQGDECESAAGSCCQ